MPLPLSEIFPDEDYRFHLTLRKGDLGAFFGQNDEVRLEDRARWIATDPERYVLAAAECAGALDAFERFLAGLGVAKSSDAQASPNHRLANWGAQLEADFVLFSRDDLSGVNRARAGVVCFPSSWIPEEKLGQTLEEIHGVVPGLNASIGPAISQFLQKLKPGAAYERSNWGLAATPELNMHPALKRPNLHTPFNPAHLWLRIEDQILAALDREGTLVFGIKLRIVPFAHILADRGLRRGLHRALATMPEAFLVYKGIAPIRAELLRALPEI